MARRKEHTHDEIKAMAITVVLQHLEQHPLDELSLRKVATAIGYVPSTLVKVFGSYQSLLLTVAEQTLEQLFQQLNSVSKADDLQALLAMAQGYQMFASTQPRPFQLIFELKAQGEDALSAGHERLIRQLFELIEDRLTTLLPALDKKELVKASRCIWAGVHGIVTLGLDDKLFASAISVSELVNHHLEVQLRGLGYHKEAICY